MPARAARRLRRAVGLPEQPGVLVRSVLDDSAAERAGLTRGDLIVGAGGQPWRASTTCTRRSTPPIRPGSWSSRSCAGAERLNVTVAAGRGDWCRGHDPPATTPAWRRTIPASRRSTPTRAPSRASPSASRAVGREPAGHPADPPGARAGRRRQRRGADPGRLPAHLGPRRRRARARGPGRFVDGREFSFSIAGSDRLSDLAVVRTEARDLIPASSATPSSCASASWWSRSATPTASRARSPPASSRRWAARCPRAPARPCGSSTT